ncbi:inositol monophosphatase 3 [Galendromus occidentalis]|uniref:inositol-phosphate phosphatase n=1 Tax=Galendromus occidentalis TaxID=34638 RepID=A0AAJ7P8Z4_9ACAR|nr:inositol monophosphatase 3 [Galendromus occidentalis]
MVWMKQCRPANLSIVLGLAFVLVLVHYTLYTEMQASRIERVSLRLLLRTSVLAAIRGGNEVVRARQENLNIRSKGINQLGQVDPLTDGDMRSHRVMLKTLFKIFPHLNVVSEEHEDEKTSSQTSAPGLDDVNLPESISNFVDETVRLRDILVWIDPLDATQEYTEGLTEYVTTMVCIAVEGRAHIGVIHQPFANRTVWGWVGQGPSRSLRGPQIADDDDGNNSIIMNSINIDNAYNTKKVKPDDDAVDIVVSRSHAGKVKQFARDALGGDITVTSAGGSGYKALQVAESKADLYIHTTLIKKWDICAGNAILESLGGRMVNLKGEAIDYGSPRSEKNPDGLLAFLKDKRDFMKLTRAPLPA